MHKLFAIMSAVFLIIVSISGIFLGIKPFYYEWVYFNSLLPIPKSGTNIANIVDVLTYYNEGVIKIFTVSKNLWIAVVESEIENLYYVIDPNTGRFINTFKHNPVFEFFHTLHTRMFLDNIGRIFVLIASTSMVILGISGLQKISRKKKWD